MKRTICWSFYWLTAHLLLEILFPKMKCCGWKANICLEFFCSSANRSILFRWWSVRPQSWHTMSQNLIHLLFWFFCRQVKPTGFFFFGNQGQEHGNSSRILRGIEMIPEKLLNELLKRISFQFQTEPTVCQWSQNNIRLTDCQWFRDRLNDWWLGVQVGNG